MKAIVPLPPWLSAVIPVLLFAARVLHRARLMRAVSVQPTMKAIAVFRLAVLLFTARVSHRPWECRPHPCNQSAPRPQSTDSSPCPSRSPKQRFHSLVFFFVSHCTGRDTRKRPVAKQFWLHCGISMGFPPSPKAKIFGSPKKKSRFFFGAKIFVTRIFALGEGGSNGVYLKFHFFKKEKSLRWSFSCVASCPVEVFYFSCFFAFVPIEKRKKKEILRKFLKLFWRKFWKML